MAGNDRSPKARALGAALRTEREERGLGLRQLASQIGCAPGTLSRWETGERMPKRADVARILDQLEVSGARYDEVLDMTTPAANSRWLAITLPENRQHLAALLECERTATSIFHMSPLLVPGLLQTTSYTRAIMTAGGVPEDEVETRIAVRIGRREVVTKPDAPQITYVIGEAALHQMIGSADVMVEQLGHLLDVYKLKNVNLHVVPFERSWHPGLEGPYQLIDSDQGPSVVYIETRASGIFLHDKADLDEYRTAAETLLGQALDPTASRTHIANVRKKVEAGL
ncbi:helix-turn-helix domain-containing protein [Saccharopolyspora sp. NPDC002376]